MTEQLRIIGVMGKSKSGKDTVGEMIAATDPRARTLAFADKLKSMICDLFGAKHDDLYTEAGKKSKSPFPLLKCPSCASIRCELVAEQQVLCGKCTAVGEPKAFQTFWEWREIAQFAGTEFGRFVDPGVWVRHAFKEVARMMRPTGSGSTDGSVPSVITPGASCVVITDCRFKSEKLAIEHAGGEVWRVRRPETDNQRTGLTGHLSETEMDTIPDTEFAQLIRNDASLEVLRARVQAAYEHYRERCKSKS